MRNLRILAALGLLAGMGAAQAEVSGTAAIVSDYDFRGITQTGEEPALQLSIDYANASGWYAGIWGSNVDQFSDGGINTASTEVDLYTGFKGTAGSLGWDAGIVYYTYAGASDLNYPEIYGKLSFGIVSGGLYYSNSFGHKDNGSAVYVYGDVGVPVGPVTLGAHVGLSDGDGIQDAYCAPDSTGACTVAVFSTPEDSYMDYGLGVSYPAGKITLGLKWVAFDADDGGSDDRIILSFSTALPLE